MKFLVNDELEIGTIGHPAFCSKKFCLPVYTELDESSELSLIELYNIYYKYKEYLDYILDKNVTDRFEYVPWKFVNTLNVGADILISYLQKLGVRKYVIDVDGLKNMNPVESTPRIQYVYEAVCNNLNLLEQEF